MPKPLPKKLAQGSTNDFSQPASAIGWTKRRAGVGDTGDDRAVALAARVPVGDYHLDLGTAIANAAVAIVMRGFLNDLGFRRRDPAVWRKFDGMAG